MAAQPSARYQRKADHHQTMIQATTGECQAIHTELAWLYHHASEQASYLEHMAARKYTTDVAMRRAKAHDKLTTLKQAIKTQVALLKGAA